MFTLKPLGNVDCVNVSFLDSVHIYKGTLFTFLFFPVDLVPSVWAPSTCHLSL